jgi:predicted ribosome quality control (RQC) complex YloA/Tae2 family protein
MQIEKIEGKKKEIWSIQYNGYGWFETYGQSMTDWATFYDLDYLLKIDSKEKVDEFEKKLPPEINTFKKLMKVILDEICEERKKIKNETNEGLLYAISLIPTIKEHLK